jgi:hypothetical protein
MGRLPAALGELHQRLRSQKVSPVTFIKIIGLFGEENQNETTPWEIQAHF